MHPGRQEIMSDEHLAKICDNSGISVYINKDCSQQGIIPPKVKAATIKAIVAAVRIDMGKEWKILVVEKVLRSIGLEVLAYPDLKP